MTIKDIKHEKSDALPPSHSDNISAPPIDLDEIDVPVATVAATPQPAINPEYDPTGDSVIVVNDARVVVREDKKTILLPDFSQKIIEHRHMDDGTVDVFTRHVRNDGTSTYFEQLGVAESELALGPDGPCSPDQYKAGVTYPPMPTQPNEMGSGGHDPGASHHPNEQHENMKRKRINKLAIHIIVFVALIVLAALYAEFLFFPAIIVGIVVIANAVQLVTGETDCCSCCDDCCDDGCCDGCDPPSV